MHASMWLNVAADVASTLMGDGATAVILTGSHARGDANAESDLDIYAIGQGAPYRLFRRDRFLVSVSWRTVEQIRQAFESPSDAGGIVPGWRQAIILRDPDGVAAMLRREARGWTWNRIEDETCNRWVAAEVTGYAEEVHKLVSLLSQGNATGAAIQRSALALRLARILAVHHHLLYDTENMLWDDVSSRMGEPWTRVQEAALGLYDEPLDVTCCAALEMFILACREIWPLFDTDQQMVADHACALAGRQLSGNDDAGERVL